MTTTKQGRTPGRPRQFDAEQAIETAQRLFHARGYDAVSVANLTQAFGINPRAFMPLLAVSSGCIPASCSATARPGPFPSMPCCETTSRWRRRSSPYCRRRLAAMWPIRPPPAAWCWRGCVQDADARVAARRMACCGQSQNPAVCRRHRPQDALRVTDYMDTLMLGLSAKAREGDSLPRLLETVRLAGLALERILPA